MLFKFVYRLVVVGHMTYRTMIRFTDIYQNSNNDGQHTIGYPAKI